MNLLTRERFTFEPELTEVTNCEDPCCGTCEMFAQERTKRLKNVKELKVNANMNCKIRNLIDCITCPQCNENYVRNTGKKLISPVNVHKQILWIRFLGMSHIMNI